MPDRPFENLGKTSLNLLGKPNPMYAPDQQPIEAMPIAFKGIPVLEQVSQGAGFVGEVIGRSLNPFASLPAIGAWEASADDPERARYAQAVASNAISIQEAQARFYRYTLDRDDVGPELMRNFMAPQGGGLSQGLEALSLLQKGVLRTLQPLVNRLDSLRTASDAELEDNPELIAIRDGVKNGTITDDEAYDRLVNQGATFALMNPLKSDIPFLSGSVSLGLELLTDPLNLISFGGAGLISATSRAVGSGSRLLARELGEQGMKDLAQSMAVGGIKLTDQSALDFARESPTLLPKLEAALAKASPLTRKLILDAPRLTKVGIEMRDFLDPLTLFGRDAVGKISTQQFAFKAGEGAMNGFGMNVMRTSRAKAVTLLGREVADALDGVFNTAAGNVVVQVGAENLVRHVRWSNSLDGLSDTTKAAVNSARSLGGDIGRRVQDMLERKRLRLNPLRAGAEGLVEMRAAARGRATNQIGKIAAGRASADQIDTFVAGLSDNELSLLDFQHYGHAIETFLPARSAAMKEVAEGFVTDVPVARLTFIGPRQLTKQGLEELRAALKARNASAVRSIVEQYDELYRVYDLDLTDKELLRVMKETLDQLGEHLPSAIDDISTLPPSAQRWVSEYESMGYKAMLRAPDEVLVRPIYGKNNNIIGVDPWIDLVTTKTMTGEVTKLAALRAALFNNISGTTVRREAMARFVRLGAEQHGISEKHLQRVFGAIERAAQDRNLSPRGLDAEDWYKATMAIGLPKTVRAKLNQRKVALLLLEAHEGALSVVGVTQKFTGIVKRRSLQLTSGNHVGVIAERLYGQLRFKYNPFFLLQELVETPFFMLLRGQLPVSDFKRVFSFSGRSAMAAEVDRTLWVMQHAERKGEFVAYDMAEQSAMWVTGGRALDEEMGKLGKLRYMLVPNVKGMKGWGVARTWQRNEANAIAKAMKNVSPESWGNWAAWMTARAGSRNDDEAIANFLMDAQLRSDPDSVYSRFGPSAFRPSHLGERQRISTKLVRNLVLGDGNDNVKWNAFIKRIRDPKDDLDADDIRQALETVGADPDYINRAVVLATFPTPNDFYQRFTDLGRSAEEVAAMRKSMTRQARRHQVSEHEWLSRQFADAPTTLNHMGEHRSRNLFYQEMTDAFAARGKTVVDDGDDRIFEMRDILARSMPTISESPEPWKYARGFPTEHVQYVPVRMLRRTGMQGNELGKTDIDELAADIAENGFREPLMVTYFHGDKRMVLDEGNHRLAAAERAGIDRVPVWVSRFDGNGGGRGVKVAGFAGDSPPGQMSPASIGIKGTTMEPVLVKSLTRAQQLGRQARQARARRARNPLLGSPEAMAGAIPSGRGRVMRGDQLLHKVGPVAGPEWFDMLGVLKGDLKEKALWFIEMRKSFLALVDNDPEQAAQLMMTFGLSQLNTSPVAGMAFVQTMLGKLARGEALPTSKSVGGLNVGAIKRYLETGMLDPADARMATGLGQKLVDFIDSLAGAKRRTMGVDGPNPARPWGPVAGDVWVKRDVGFLDPKMAAHLRQVYGAKRVTYGKGVGYTVDMGDGDTFVLGDNLVTSEAPDDDEYDFIVEFYNDRATEASAQNFLGRSDWEAAEMQALGWFRAKTAMGDLTGSPRDAIFKNASNTAVEAAPGPGSNLADLFPPSAEVPFEVMTRITGDVLRTFDTQAQNLTGVRTISMHQSWGPWQGARQANTTFEVFGTNMDVQAHARVMAYLARQEGVPVSRPSGSAQARPRDGILHAVDWVPAEGGTLRQAEDAMDLLVKREGSFAGNGAGIIRYDDGTYGVRSVWTARGEGWNAKGYDPALDKQTRQVTKTRSNGTKHEVTEGVPLPARAFRDAWDDGSIAGVRAGGQEWVPERHHVEASYHENDWGNFPDGEQHIQWLRDNGYGTVADKLQRDGFGEANAAYERAYSQHYGRETLEWRGNRAATDPEWAARSRALFDLDDARTADGLGYRGVDDTGGRGPDDAADGLGAGAGPPDGAGRAAGQPDADGPTGAAPVGEQLFQVRPKGTLAAISFDAVDGRKRIYLNRRGQQADSLLHEISHGVAEELDPSGRATGLRAFNEDRARVAGRPVRRQKGDVRQSDIDVVVARNKTLQDSYDAEVQVYAAEKLTYDQRVVEAEAAAKVAAASPTAGVAPTPVAPNNPVRTIHEKWRNRDARNSVHMEKDLVALEQADIDVSEAMDALEDYRGMERGDFSDVEEFSEARDEAWDEVLNRLDEMSSTFDDDLDVAAVQADALPATRPEAPRPSEAPAAAPQPVDVGPSPIPPEVPALEAVPALTPKRQTPVPTPKTVWDEEVHEWFVAQYIQWVRTGETPSAAVAPLFGYYREALADMPAHAKVNPEVQAMLAEHTSRKAEASYAFNADEAGLLDTMLVNADQASRRARDLVHFRTSRSWLERTLNHPYFGMYPLSYMWGKVLPELVEFLMFRPFGLRAPLAGLNTVNDLYQHVMLQQEYDPELRKYMADNEPHFRSLAMLTPGVPWDLPVNSPLWLRRMGEAVATMRERELQGKTNADGSPARVDLGKIDYFKIATDTAGYALNPVRGFENIADAVQAGVFTAGLAAGAATPESTPDRRVNESAPLQGEMQGIDQTLGSAVDQLTNALSGGNPAP